MKIAIVIPPNNFKDETLSKAELLLDKKGIEHKLASFTSATECRGYHGAVRKPDVHADALEPSEFDAILLIDGPGVDSYKLYEHRRLLDTIKAFHDSKKIIAGFDNSIKILARSNIIRDTKIAKIKDEETSRLVTLYKGVLTEDSLIFNNNLLTATDYSQAETLISKLAEKLGIF